jgi:hypothetical protein
MAEASSAEGGAPSSAIAVKRLELVPQKEAGELLLSNRAWLEAQLNARRRPDVPAVLAPLIDPHAEAHAAERAAAEQARKAELAEAAARAEEAKALAAKTEESIACDECGQYHDKLGNEILLCDTPGCELGFHMLCLPTPVAAVPKGDWFCPRCRPPKKKWCVEREHSMELAVGTKLFAQDKKGQWGEARVLKTVEQEAAGAGADAAGSSASDEGASGASSGASEEPRNGIGAVLITFKGFSKKYDETLRVGDGRLRALEVGPPSREGFGEDFYLVEEVTDMMVKSGRKLYLTKWEGYDEPSWEPRNSFVGDEAREKLADFFEKQKRLEQAAANEAVAAEAAASAHEGEDGGAGGDNGGNGEAEGEAGAGGEGSEGGDGDGGGVAGDREDTTDSQGCILRRGAHMLPKVGLEIAIDIVSRRLLLSTAGTLSYRWTARSAGRVASTPWRQRCRSATCRTWRRSRSRAPGCTCAPTRWLPTAR